MKHNNPTYPAVFSLLALVMWLVTAGTTVYSDERTKLASPDGPIAVTLAVEQETISRLSTPLFSLLYRTSYQPENS